MDKKENVSLKEYFNTRLNELKRYMEMKFNAINEASILASENMKTRLDNMNEFRESLKDQTNEYMPRAEFNIIIAKYEADIRMLRESNAEMKGKASNQSVMFAGLIAVAGIIIGVVGLLVK